MPPESSVASAREHMQHLLSAGVRHAPSERRRSWAMDYGPGARDWGDRLGDLHRDLQRSVFRVLSSILSSDAFIEVGISMAMEYVMDAQSIWTRDRSPGDFWLEVRTGRDDTPNGFALEGHHLSLDVRLVRDEWEVRHAFFGAVPARTPTTGGWMHDLLAGLRVAAEAVVDCSPRRVDTEEAVPGIESGQVGAPDVGLLHPVEAATAAGFIDAFDRRFAPAARLVGHRSASEPLARIVAPSGIRGDHYVAVRHGRLLYEYLNRVDAGPGPNHIHSSVRRVNV